MRTPAKKARSAPLLQVGGTDGPHTLKVLAVLEKVAMAATANGREAVAIAAVQALGDIGAVKSVSITSSVFNG